MLRLLRLLPNRAIGANLDHETVLARLANDSVLSCTLGLWKVLSDLPVLIEGFHECGCLCCLVMRGVLFQGLVFSNEQRIAPNAERSLVRNFFARGVRVVIRDVGSVSLLLEVLSNLARLGFLKHLPYNVVLEVALERSHRSSALLGVWAPRLGEVWS